MENQLSSSGIFFPGFTSIEILRQIQRGLNARHINPEQLEGRILFMWMFNDIDWTRNRNYFECILNASEVSDYAKEFPRGHWSFLGPGNEEHGLGRMLTNQKGSGTSKPIK